MLELIGRYRDEDQSKDWHRLAEEAVQRFPDNSAVLLQATASAVARKAYKKAAGFARRLLQIDPINAGVRRQMIELQVAHARKQMRARRADLAAKELARRPNGSGRMPRAPCCASPRGWSDLRRPRATRPGPGCGKGWPSPAAGWPDGSAPPLKPS